MTTVRRPFKLPGRANFYIDIDRKRRCLNTPDEAEALKIYNEICRRANAEEKKPEALEGVTKLGQFRERYLNWAKAVRPTATYRAEALSFRHLADVIGDVPLTTIGAEHLDKLSAALRTNGASVGTVNHYLRHLKAIFSRAEAWKLVPVNPFRKFKLLKQQQGPPMRVRAEDFERLLSAQTDPDVVNLLRVYLATGRRRGEIANLTWDNIDFERNRYYVVKSKDGLSRWYPMPKALREVLQGMPEPREGKIFKWEPDTISHKVKEALRAAGMGDLHLHHLRHSFGAAFIESGGDVRTLMDLLGHRQISTTLIYTRLSPEHLAKEIDRVEVPPLKPKGARKPQATRKGSKSA